MGLIHKCKQGLFLLLHRERQWPGYFIDLQYAQDQPPLLSYDFQAYQENSPVLSMRLIPEYFNYRIDKNKHTTVCIKQHNWGYAIKLNSCKSASNYLSQQFNSSARRTILRYVKRLEHCLEISYDLHYGGIEREQYDFLMEHLYSMMVARFDMKGERHKELPFWDEIVSQTFDQIKRKEASLFVIYHGQKPIEISLNYHLGKMLFSSISSFDMDYSKFGLGHVEIFKQLEWCLNNKYFLYDMGVGGTDYKRRWSNYIYRFEHHILYPKAGLINRLSAFGERCRVQIKETLKSVGINEISQKMNSFNSKQKPLIRSKNSSPILKLGEEKERPRQTEKRTSLTKENDSLQLIRKQLNNFLYSTQEHEKNIKIWQLDTNTYRIEGKEHYQHLDINADSVTKHTANH